jgi:hypothetical protein
MPNENQNQKIVLFPKDGEPVKILTGTDFHTLEDRTLSTLKTNDLMSFVEFVNKLELTDKEKIHVQVIYNDKKCVAWPCVESFEYLTQPIAECDLSASVYIQRLSKFSSEKYSLDTLEDFLMSMRGFLDDEGKKLLDDVRHFSMEKLTSISRERDNAANYAFSVTVKDSGKSAFVLPKTIAFKVPVFDMLASGTNDITIMFEPRLKYTVGQEGVKVEMSFQCFDFDDILHRVQKKVVEEQLTALYSPKYWGEITVTRKTDSWRYLHIDKGNGSV